MNESSNSQFEPSQAQIDSYLDWPESRCQAFGRLLSTPVMSELYKFYYEETQRVDSRNEFDKFADSAWATIELFGLWRSFLAIRCHAKRRQVRVQSVGRHTS